MRHVRLTISRPYHLGTLGHRRLLVADDDVFGGKRQQNILDFGWIGQFWAERQLCGFDQCLARLDCLLFALATMPRKLPSRTIAITPGIAFTVASSTLSSLEPGRGGRTMRPCTMRGSRISCR